MTEQFEENLRDALQHDVESFHRARAAGPRTMTTKVTKRVRRRQTGTVLTAVLSGCLIVAGVLWLVPSLPQPLEPRSAEPTLAGSDIVDVPPRGEARPVFLADGSPAFVVTHEDGSASAVAAFSAHVPWGIEYLVMWCPSSGWFEDPFHGSKYDEYGTYWDGPGPSGLGVYRTDELEDRVRVRSGTAYVAPRPGQPQSSPPPLGGMDPGILTPSSVDPVGPRGPFCTSADEAVFHKPSAENATPLEAIGHAPDGWTVLEGTLVLEADQPVRMCTPNDDTRCVPLSVPFISRAAQSTFEEVGDHTVRFPGPGTSWRRPLWLARIVDGEVLSLAAPVPPRYRAFLAEEF